MTVQLTTQSVVRLTPLSPFSIFLDRIALALLVDHWPFVLVHFFIPLCTFSTHADHKVLAVKEQGKDSATFTSYRATRAI